MNDWKTTIPGVAGGIALVLRSFFPEYETALNMFIASALAFLGFSAKQTP
jgi:hypothetical protein